MVSSSLYDDPAMEAFPVLVIEKSDLTEREILDNAPARHHKKIKTQAICVERLRASKKVLVYAIFPAAHQSYLSESMNHCHYQVRQSGGSRDMQALRAAVKAANETKGVEASLIEILPCQLKFDDGFLRVDNNPDLSGIDFSVIKKKLEGLPKDPERNNVCLDLGYSGQHNTKRDVRYFGLPHSNLRDHTTEPWAVDMFVGVTECIDTNYPDVCEQVYNDPERNMVFANEIDPDNDLEELVVTKQMALTFSWPLTLINRTVLLLAMLLLLVSAVWVKTKTVHVGLPSTHTAKPSTRSTCRIVDCTCLLSWYSSDCMITCLICRSHRALMCTQLVRRKSVLTGTTPNLTKVPCTLYFQLECCLCSSHIPSCVRMF